MKRDSGCKTIVLFLSVMSNISNPYIIHRLDNGLRVVACQTSGNVTYSGVVINAGSRDEDISRSGLAHFVEHTIFKGTPSRKSWQITDRMERIGGELNAYTSKEETVIYTNAPKGHSERAFQLLGDIIANSAFPAEELRKEKEVIVEEIYSYLDSPSDRVFDDFEELIYKGSGLAHNILGDEESLRRLSGADCRGFLDRFYTPGNMVVYCADSGDPEKNIRLAEKYFGSLRFPLNPHDRKTPESVTAFDERRDLGNHQANTLVGARVFGRSDSRRFALFLLNNYLAGPCMNSRLNRELREKRGYVYTVDSNVSLMSDCGLLLVYFGCDPSNVGKCRRIVLNEIDRLAQSPLTPRRFEAAREQYCGQLLVSSDHRESVAMSMGKSVMYYGQVNDVAATAESIRKVTAEEVCEVARMIVDNGCSSLTLV